MPEHQIYHMLVMLTAVGFVIVTAVYLSLGLIERIRKGRNYRWDSGPAFFLTPVSVICMSWVISILS